MQTIEITPQTTVSAIAAAYPETLRMFEALGVDYCCGGKLPLADAVRTAKAPLETVIAVLTTTIAQGTATMAERDWLAVPLPALMDEIVATHHTYLNRELPRLEGLLALVARVHGPNHGDVLQPLVETFAALKAELEAHLRKEEEVTFPAIRALHAGTADETARRTMLELETEHEGAGAALAAMHRITGDFTLPADACNTFAAVYRGLRELEADIHHHIHLENNVLFPRVRAEITGCACAA
jgi:regulator of cell morphogenesis and NO signaling